MLYLVRHGEATFNAQGRIMGQRDEPLTQRGEAQAAALGRWLARRGVALTAVYSSDLQRAQATARALAAACGSGQVISRPQLREVGRGLIEGLLLRDAAEARRDPEVIASFEPTAKVEARIAQIGTELRQRAVGGDIAAVAHGGSLSRLLRFYLGLDLEGHAGLAGFAFDNTGVTLLDFRPARAVVLFTNALYHLEGPRLPVPPGQGRARIATGP